MNKEPLGALTRNSVPLNCEGRPLYCFFTRNQITHKVESASKEFQRRAQHIVLHMGKMVRRSKKKNFFLVKGFFSSLLNLSYLQDQFHSLSLDSVPMSYQTRTQSELRLWNQPIWSRLVSLDTLDVNIAQCLNSMYIFDSHYLLFIIIKMCFKSMPHISSKTPLNS